jgi:hypothetical protein
MQSEQGVNYTSKLETMFKDMKVNEEEKPKWRDHLANLEVCGG